MEVRFKDENGQQHILAIRPQSNGSGWELKESSIKGVSVDEATGMVTLAADIVQDGSEVTAVNYLDRGSAVSSEVVTVIANRPR